jgi:hypothetical protein
MTAVVFMPNSCKGGFPNPEGAMVDYGSDDSLVGFLEEQIRIIWNTKSLIAACAVTAALAGYFGAKLLPKTYEASVVVRPQSSAQFIGLGTLLAGTAGDWRRPENIATSGYELFLRNIRNKFSREAALSSHRALFANADFDDRRTGWTWPIRYPSSSQPTRPWRTNPPR